VVKANGASKALEKEGIENDVREGSDRGASGMKTRVVGGKALVRGMRRTRYNDTNLNQG
jgi:hypothetical protein